MRRSLIAFLFSLVLTAPHVVAQGSFERILIPLYGADRIPGAFSSLWTSELVGRNTGDAYVEIVPRTSGVCGACPVPPAQPHSTFNYVAQIPNPGGGLFLYIAASGAANISFNARIQDVSREALTWGTEIPIVRERDVFTGPLNLLNIPADDRFRQTLRIYDFDGRDGAQVVARVYPNDGSTLLAEQVITLKQASLDDSPSPAWPAMVQIAFGNAFSSALVNGSRLRLEITPVTPSLRIWAFISITNNETQHVTTITPQ